MKTKELILVIILLSIISWVVYRQVTYWNLRSVLPDFNIGLSLFFLLSLVVYYRFWNWFKERNKVTAIVYGCFVLLNFVLGMASFSLDGVLVLAIVPICFGCFKIIDLLFESIQKFLEKHS